MADTGGPFKKKVSLQPLDSCFIVCYIYSDSVATWKSSETKGLGVNINISTMCRLFNWTSQSI